MARRSKRSKEDAAVVGVVGSGKITKKSAKAHLSTFIESIDGEIHWVLPDSEELTKGLTAVQDFLWEEEGKFSLVVDDSAEDEEYQDAAEAVFEVSEDVFGAVVTEVSGMEAGLRAVIFLLDEESDADLDLLDAAQKEGLTCYDLSSGLQELEMEEVDEPEEEEATDEDDAEEAPAEEPGESSEEEPAVPEEVPQKVVDLIDQGKAEKAVKELVNSAERDDLQSIAEGLGIEIKKGVWAKTIAANIVDFLSTSEEPAAEEEPEEEAPAPAPKKKPSKKKKKAAPKAEDPVVEDEPAEEPVQEEIAEQDYPEAVAAPNGRVTHREVLNMLGGIAMQQGTTDAKEFYEFLKAEDLV